MFNNFSLGRRIGHGRITVDHIEFNEQESEAKVCTGLPKFDSRG